MNSKNLGILGAIAVVAIGGGIWLASERSSSSIEGTTTALYPNLKKTLNDASAIRIYKAGDELAVEIARKGDRWEVAQRNGYPADDAKVRKLLLALGNANIREEKTSNSKNYASLGVEDVSEANATGVRMEVAGVEPAVNLIVGKDGPGLDSQYVRRAGEPQSWLIDVNLDSSITVQDWLNRSILDVTADRVQAATIETKGAKPYTAAKSARTDADFKVEPLPKGKELSSPSVANSLATALAGLTLSDVRPASELADKPEARATYRTFDGLVVELDGWSREDDRFIAARARYDAALAEQFKLPSAETSDDKEKSDEAKDTDAKDEKDASQSDQKSAKPNVEEEARTLNAKLEGWVFEIPEYKYDAVFKPLSNMLKN